MLPELSSIRNLLKGGSGRLKILVAGNLMLDRYIFGKVDRISSKGLVPVLRHAQAFLDTGALSGAKGRA